MKQTYQGQCPKCDSENLTYGVAEIDGEGLFYPFTCDDCKTEGEEWYGLQFEESIINI